MRLNFVHRFFADTEIGAKLTLDAGLANRSMKDIKKEIQDARAELFNMQTQFGATSKQAFEAAKKVAVLTDNLKDANETAKLFDPGNKFQVLGNSIRGLVGGFSALQGVLALAGVEGEELQKTLLKVQGALALTEGLNVIADVAKDFKRLGSVIVQTLGKSGMIGLAIAGVALLGAALLGLFDGPSLKAKELKNSLKELEKGTIDATKEVFEMQNAFKQAEAGIITKDEALKKYNEGIGKTIGFAKDLNEAEKLTTENAAAYIEVQGLKAQANYILAKSSEISAKALIAETQLAQAKFDSRTFQGALIDQFKNDVEDQKKDAAELMSLIDGINAKIATASKGFKSTVDPSTGRTTKPDKKKEAEEEANIIADIEDEKLKAKLSVADANFKIDTDLATKKLALDKTIADSAIAANKAQMESAADLAAYEKYVSDSRIEAAQAVGNALGALAELIGKQTAAGKALAIAQAVINTWLGVTEIIKTKSVLPEPMATISRIANIVAIVAAGLNAVKNIAKANVPGASSGGGGSAGSAAPIQPQVPQATSTMLDQRQLNQIGNATARAFILDSDVVNNRERSTRLNRAARLG